MRTVILLLRLFLNLAAACTLSEQLEAVNRMDPFLLSHPPAEYAGPWSSPNLTRLLWEEYDQDFATAMGTLLQERPGVIKEGALMRFLSLAGWDPKNPINTLPRLSSLLELYEKRMRSLVRRRIVRSDQVILPRRRYHLAHQTFWVRLEDPIPLNASPASANVTEDFFQGLDLGIIPSNEPSEASNFANLPTTLHELSHMADFFFFPRYMTEFRQFGPQYQGRNAANALSMLTLETPTLVKPNQREQLTNLLNLPAEDKQSISYPLKVADHLKQLGEEKMRALAQAWVGAYPHLIHQRGGLNNDPYLKEATMAYWGEFFSPADQWVSGLENFLKTGEPLSKDPDVLEYLAALQIYFDEVKDLTTKQWFEESLKDQTPDSLIFRLFCHYELPVAMELKRGFCQ